MRRTRFDIERLFNGEQMFRDIIDGTENKKLAARFRKEAASGQWEKLATLMRSLGIIKKPLKVVSTSKSAHKSNRNKISGRVYSKRRIDSIYVSQDTDEYINVDEIDLCLSTDMKRADAEKALNDLSAEVMAD